MDGGDVMFFDNTLRKIANDKGYKVGYDNKTDSVTVENPLPVRRFPLSQVKVKNTVWAGLMRIWAIML